MARAYVVKTGEKFLCSAEDGDMGLAPELKEARRFLLREEAESAAKSFGESDYEIVVIDVDER